jgi:peptidoglycan hydrolase-like protein with peptidoglycan-binding domain
MAVAVVLPAFALASSPQLGGRVLHAGSRGADVRSLQQDLTKAGFRTRATGAYGAQTARSVRSFQSRYRLKVNGAVDARFVSDLRQVMTLDARAVDDGAATVQSDAVSGGGGLGATTVRTKATKPKSKRSTKAHTTNDPTSVLNNDPIMAPVAQDGGSAHLGERTLHKGMQGHDVRVLQSYLTLSGFPTTVDGQFGAGTRTNVIKFEHANNLAAKGVVTYAQSRVLRQDVSKAVTATGAPGASATLSADGTVTAPAGAPQAVQQAITAANSIINTPYIYGGGHGKFNDSGYDCSGAVSFALHGGGLLSAPEDSTQLESYGATGPGKWITVYADSGHAFVVIAGLAFDTAHYGPTSPGGSGARWLNAANVTANLKDGGHYIVRHPSGL